MEDFNSDNIFTLPIVLRSNCDDSTQSDCVNDLEVQLSNVNNVVQKTLLLYQDTSILDPVNGQGQPLVRFLCEVDDNNEDQSGDVPDNVQTNSSVEGSNEALNLTEGCSLSFTNGDIGDDSSSLRFEMGPRDADITNVVSVRRCDVDLLNSSLDEFIQTVVLFQCRLCQHASNDKNDIIRHLRSFHLINNTQKEGMVILEDCKESNCDIETRQIKMDEDKGDETQTVYMCGKCSLPFETMAECKSHMASHPKAKSGSKVNNKALKKDASKIVHLTIETAEPMQVNGSSTLPMKEESSEESITEGKHCHDLVKEKNVKCEMESCDMKFSTNDYMKQHVECHIPTDASQYKCSRCHYMFSRWSELALHLWKSHHIDLDLFKCSVCTFKSVSRLVLRRHFKNHAVGDYYCLFCGKSFIAEERYKEHMSTHRTQETNTKDKKKKKKTVECGECGVRLSSAKALKKHVKVVHGKLRPHVCHVCPFTSSTLATLTLHLRQHTGETPFTCENCDFKTRDHNTMRRHRMRHSFVKPYSCKHCNFSSVQSTQLKNHLLKFHPESKDVFKCPDCTFATLSESLITSHRKVHHRDGRQNKISDEENRDRNLSSMFPASKCKENGDASKSNMEVEDEESSSQCYFENEQHIDTGGITIPAEESEIKVDCGAESQLNDPGGGIQTTNGVLVPNEDTMPLS